MLHPCHCTGFEFSDNKREGLDLARAERGVEFLRPLPPGLNHGISCGESSSVVWNRQPDPSSMVSTIIEEPLGELKSEDNLPLS